MEQADTRFKIEDRLLRPDEIKQLASLIIDEPDHYTALGVDRNASYQQINQSYCLAVKYFHPHITEKDDKRLVAAEFV